MAFCTKEKQFIDSGHTTVDNKFFINYMPDAPDIRTAVYLLGLTVADSDGDDNSCDTIANKLGITPAEVLDAYRYWEELGLVVIVSDPAQVIYLAMRDSASSLKKIKPAKYAKFTKAIQSVIEGRMITVNEYNEYYTFLENTTFEPDALVAVAKYCVELKGNDINYRYILTVARNQAIRGATTLVTVSENLSSQQKYDEDIKLVFKAISSNRKIDYGDRVLYEKWVKEFGFTLDVIVAVAKRCKTKGMSGLDAMLAEYYRNGVLSVKEIENYEQEKTRLYELARTVNKAIGVYYQSLDSVVEEYIAPWLRKGFDDETLIAVAKYCFRSGIRSLAGVNAVIDKLYKNGITNLNALDAYLCVLAETDRCIQCVLAKCGLDRRVTPNDRTLYKTWTEAWSMPQQLIEYVAELSAGTSSPMAYINRVLADYKQNGIFSVEQAKDHKQNARQASSTATTAIIGKDMERRHYTDDELSALFTALDTED